MEEKPKLSGVTFKAQQHSPLHRKGESRNMNWNRGEKYRTVRSSNGGLYNNNESAESRNSLTGTMEYLCRSWSPSSSDFLYSLPSTSTSTSTPQKLLPLNINDKTEDYQVEDTLSEISINTKKRNKTRVELNDIKRWLNLGKSLPSFLKSQREKRKEENRFYAAKLHAALSLTQLAAAMASFATSSTSTDSTSMALVQEQTEMMGAFTSAAALMTTVWAESAESLGARKLQIASAINSGLAITSPLDMIGVTATATTSLRGAAVLKSRFMEESYFPRSQEMLRVGAEICIIMPSGHRECKWVTIYVKHRELVLSFRKKYFGGALTTSKEYKAINIIEENKKDDQREGYTFIKLKTNKGIMKLLFEDEKQSAIWISTISTYLNTPNCIHKKFST